MKIIKAPISKQTARTASGEARVLTAKAKAAEEQARDAKMLARLAKKRLKQARHDFKLARKTSKKARKEAKGLQAAALAATRKAANLRRRKKASLAAQKARRSKRKPVQKAGAVVRATGAKSAVQGKIKAKPARKLRRIKSSKPVVPLPENLSRLVAANPAQHGIQVSEGGATTDGAGGPAPIPPAQPAQPDATGEPAG